eukprot:8021646-Pyramimonas_sp.AAC.3
MMTGIQPFSMALTYRNPYPPLTPTGAKQKRLLLLNLVSSSYELGMPSTMYCLPSTGAYLANCSRELIAAHSREPSPKLLSFRHSDCDILNRPEKYMVMFRLNHFPVRQGVISASSLSSAHAFNACRLISWPTRKSPLQTIPPLLQIEESPSATAKKDTNV